MNNKRLLILAKFLEEKVPRKQFNYCFFFGRRDEEGVEFETCTAPTQADCGTIGCAMGWAPQVPQFKRLGLRVLQRDSRKHCKGEFAIGRRFYGNAFMVASKLFDIEISAAELLFCPEDDEENYTAKQVAKKIRRFVKANAS